MKPLVVITRGEEQGKETGLELAQKFEQVEILHLPLLEFSPVEIDPIGEKTLSELSEGRFDWLIITSANSVRFLHRISPDLPTTTKVAAQGVKTADVFRKLYGRDVNFIPRVKVSESFVEELLGELYYPLTLKVSVVGAVVHRNSIEETFCKFGIPVAFLPLYQTTTLRFEGDLFRDSEHRKVFFLFFSPSAVNAAVKAADGQSVSSFTKALRSAQIVSIGPVTSAAIRESGLSLAAEAIEPTVSAVGDALLALLSIP